jgi:endonuclease/exonuclease/phosphatase family metal-dependent hydrolase
MLNIFSSNIRFENPSDGPNDWPFRKALLSSILNSNDAHIVCSQEGRKSQLMDLNSLLDTNIVDGHRSYIAERMYPTIFVNGDIQIDKSQDIWLSNTPNIAGSKSFNSMFPRLCTYIRFTYMNKDFILVNTHLDHVEENTRLEQTKVLVREINKVHKDEYIIVCGDFNTKPQSKVHSHLLESLSLIDPWYDFYSKEESTHHPFTGNNLSGSRIDWILLDKRLQVEEFKIIKDNIHGKYPSDHFPIFAKIKL